MKISKTHELKILPEYYNAVVSGDKTFEIRENDRNYTVGDMLLLKEYNSESKKYTGQKIRKEICYMTDYAQRNGYVVLGIRDVNELFPL